MFKTKTTSKLFLQQKDDENFKMIVIEEDKPNFQASYTGKDSNYVVRDSLVLPSGFKPLASSTPKSYNKPFEVIAEEPIITRLAPRLTMQKFIGEIPCPPERRRQQEYYEKAIIVDLVQKKECRAKTSWGSWKLLTSDIVRSNNKLQGSRSSIDSIDNILESIFDIKSPSKNNKSTKRSKEQNQDTFKFFENFVEGETSVSYEVSFGEPSILKKIRADKDFTAICSSHPSSKGFTSQKISEALPPKNLAKFKTIENNQNMRPPLFPDFDFSVKKTSNNTENVQRKIVCGRIARRMSSEFESFLQKFAKGYTEQQWAVHDLTLGNFVPFDDFHMDTSEKSNDEETNNFDGNIMWKEESILEMPMFF